MEHRPLKLPGASEFILSPIRDERGYFMTTYFQDLFRITGAVGDWVQENESFTRHQGTIRGLHFQAPPYAQAKLIRVVSGRVLDVFVDLRTQLESYGKWDSIEISSDRANMVYIPKGFAHGFCTLADDTIVVYKVDAYYMPEAERGIGWNDPDLAIPWPCAEPQLSNKDHRLPLFGSFRSPF